MNGRSDQELMREYATRRTEAAFAELVRRHIDLVHSTAVRLVRDPHLAEDVTQSVFIAFGKSAHRLSERAVVSGWLHRTTQNLAAKLVRTETRRRAREQEAAAMNERLAEGKEPEWDQVAPHLDAALNELAEADRDALLLRYFDRKPAREIGGVLGLSEEAAQKRVTRALEKLRGVFAARGITVSATGLGSLLALHAVQTAPAALATVVASASLAAGSVSTVTLLSLMASTKLKLVAAAVVVAGLVTPIVLQQQQLRQLRSQNAALLEPVRAAESPRDAGNRAGQSSPDADELARRQAEHLELLRLRGEVTRLRGELRQMTALKTETGTTNPHPPEAVPAAQPPVVSYPRPSTMRVSDGGTVAMGGWRASADKRGFLLVTPLLVDPAGNPMKPASTYNFDSRQQVRLATALIEVPEAELSSSILQQINDPTLQSAPVLAEDNPDLRTLLSMAQAPGTSNVLASPTVITLHGRQAQVAVGQQVPVDDGSGNLQQQFVGTTIDLLPRVSSDGSTIDVEAAITVVPPEAVTGGTTPQAGANRFRNALRK